MSGVLTGSVFLHHDSISPSTRCEMSNRRHCNEHDVSSLDCNAVNRNDVIKRRAHQLSSSKRKDKHQSQRQPEVGGSSSVNARALSDDEEADDAVSVCSGVSSASGSSGGTGHRHSARKSRCPVHSQRKRPEIIEPNVGELSEKLTVCCCRSAKRKKNSVKRPEPEGGLQSAMLKSTMDEFESLIYGPNEPLFSDCDVTTDDVIEVVELRTSCDKPVRKCQRDNNNVVDLNESLFGSSQMINTNTSMKMAIIQNELKNVKAVSIRRAENDMTSLSRRADVIKESCAQSEHSMQTANQLLGEILADFKADIDVNSEKDCLQNYSHSKQCVSNRGSARVHTTTNGNYRRLITTDVDIERAANNLDAAEVKVTELEEELKSLVGSMNGSSSERKEKAIRDVTLRLKEAEHRAMLAEQEVFGSRRQAAANRAELVGNLKKFQPVGSVSCSFTLADLLGY